MSNNATPFVFAIFIPAPNLRLKAVIAKPPIGRRGHDAVHASVAKLFERRRIEPLNDCQEIRHRLKNRAASLLAARLFLALRVMFQVCVLQNGGLRYPPNAGIIQKSNPVSITCVGQPAHAKAISAQTPNKLARSEPRAIILNANIAARAVTGRAKPLTFFQNDNSFDRFRSRAHLWTLKLTQHRRQSHPRAQINEIGRRVEVRRQHRISCDDHLPYAIIGVSLHCARVGSLFGVNLPLMRSAVSEIVPLNDQIVLFRSEKR